MKKNLLSMACFLLVALWADAQTQPIPLLLADRVRLHQVNRVLLEELLEQTIRLSNSDSTLARAEHCRVALNVLGNEVGRTLERPAAEPERITELTDYMSDLAINGLIPTLEQARAEIRAGSPGAEQLKKIELQTTTDLTELLIAMTIDARLARSTQVTMSLNKLRDALPAIKPQNLELNSGR